MKSLGFVMGVLATGGVGLLFALSCSDGGSGESSAPLGSGLRPLQASGNLAAVRPLEPCVSTVIGEKVVFSGYENSSSQVVTIPPGPKNQFLGAPSEVMTSPLVFLPGKHPFAVLRSYSPGERWVLGATGVSRQDDASLPACPETNTKFLEAIVEGESDIRDVARKFLALASDREGFVAPLVGELMSLNSPLADDLANTYVTVAALARESLQGRDVSERIAQVYNESTSVQYLRVQGDLHRSDIEVRKALERLIPADIGATKAPSFLGSSAKTQFEALVRSPAMIRSAASLSTLAPHPAYLEFWGGLVPSAQLLQPADNLALMSLGRSHPELSLMTGGIACGLSVMGAVITTGGAVVTTVAAVAGVPETGGLSLLLLAKVGLAGAAAGASWVNASYQCGWYAP